MVLRCPAQSWPGAAPARRRARRRGKGWRARAGRSGGCRAAWPGVPLPRRRGRARTCRPRRAPGPRAGRGSREKAFARPCRRPGAGPAPAPGGEHDPARRRALDQALAASRPDHLRDRGRRQSELLGDPADGGAGGLRVSLKIASRYSSRLSLFTGMYGSLRSSLRIAHKSISAIGRETLSRDSHAARGAANDEEDERDDRSGLNVLGAPTAWPYEPPTSSSAAKRPSSTARATASISGDR